MKKFDDKRYGPFKVLEKIGASAYKLELPPSMSRIHPVFNEVLLHPYKKPSYESQQQLNRPEPVVVDQESEWEVEEILASRHNRRRRRVEYLVHWKGYGPQERTWEPLENLENSQEALQEFLRKNPSAHRQVSTQDFQAIRFIPLLHDNFPIRYPPHSKFIRFNSPQTFST